MSCSCLALIILFSIVFPAVSEPDVEVHITRKYSLSPHRSTITIRTRRKIAKNYDIEKEYEMERLAYARKDVFAGPERDDSGTIDRDNEFGVLPDEEHPILQPTRIIPDIEGLHTDNATDSAFERGMQAYCDALAMTYDQMGTCVTALMTSFFVFTVFWICAHRCYCRKRVVFSLA